MSRGVQDAAVRFSKYCEPVTVTNSRAQALPNASFAWPELTSRLRLSSKKASSGLWRTHNLKVKYKY